MTNPAGESNGEALRLDYDRRLTLQFRGSVVTSDAGLLAYRELDDALGLSDLASERLADARTGKNGRHALVGMLRQAVFGRLAEYEDVNDAERLRHDPAMRWIVGGKAAHGCAASPSLGNAFGCHAFHQKPREMCVLMTENSASLGVPPRAGPPENVFTSCSGSQRHFSLVKVLLRAQSQPRKPVIWRMSAQPT
jgi:Transposase DDE domain group 1